MLTKLIDRELILAEVDRYAPPEPTAEAVDREVQRVLARFPSQDALDAALARSGIDEKHLRETLRQDLRMRAYLDQRFTAASDRRQALVDEWMAGLRRRGEVDRSVRVRRGRLTIARRTAESAAIADDVVRYLLSQRETARSAAGRSPAWLTIGATHERRRR